MVSETRAKVACEPYVMQFGATIEGIYALPVPDVFTNDILVFLECGPGDILDVLTDQR